MISVHDTGAAGGFGELSRFRQEFYHCLTGRADALFEVADAVLCTEGRVTSLAELSLVAEHRRGHGALYDSVNQGRVDLDRFSNLVACQQIPRCEDGRIVLAIDVSNWLRPDANTSPDRLFCHTYGRASGQAQMIPGWPYSFVAALEPGRTSWTAVLDAQRLGPDTDATALAADQLRAVVDRIIAAGHWRDGDPEIWIIGDTGYDGPRLACVLADLPVRVLVRVRSDRVMRFPAPPRTARQRGRPARHGGEFVFKDARSWPGPTHTTTTQTSRYGAAAARCWDRLHPRLTHRGPWADHDGPLPVIEGTVLQLQVDHLPGNGQPKPLWLWFSGIGVTATVMDRLWQAFLRRFDLEHTFRFLKQTLGWTRPRLRSPQAADRWSWLILAAYTQLRLARWLVVQVRRPWEPRTRDPRRLTPARVRRGFRNIRSAMALPAGVPKPSRSGPGRPPGTRNKHRAAACHVGKINKTDTKVMAGKKQED